MKMTPRERVMASVNHQNPDSLPMDLGSNVSAGISGMAYGKLKEYLGHRSARTSTGISTHFRSRWHTPPTA